MRYLVLMHGPSGSGKTTFVRAQGLEPYTIRLDALRLVLAAPALTMDGQWAIDQAVTLEVVKWLHQAVETRMQRGDLIVVDATHLTEKSWRWYKPLAERYRYRVYAVKCTAPLEVLRERNQSRPAFERVPDAVLRNQAAMAESMRFPRWITAVEPSAWLGQLAAQYRWEDWSSVRYIYHVGDLQGCWTVFAQFLADHPLEDADRWVFVGDYLDRGIENGAVAQWVWEHRDDPRCIFLEGNHEYHLQCYGRGEPASSRVFETYTKPQLQAWGITPKMAREVIRALRQVVGYTYTTEAGPVRVVVSHGGLSTLPLPVDQLVRVSARQLIWGVGSYEDPVDQQFTDRALEAAETGVDEGIAWWQVHGHRNLPHLPVQAASRSWNVDGAIEYPGGELRVVRLSRSGWEAFALPNPRPNEQLKGDEEQPSSYTRKIFAALTLPAVNGEWIRSLREHPGIRETAFGPISSFNFNETVFYSKAWDTVTTRARGLFINTQTGEIVARSYDKFFNLEERPETTWDALAAKWVFPVVAYQKEDGFLGMIGHDRALNQVVIASKTSLDGPHQQLFAQRLHRQLSAEKWKQLEALVRDERVTVVCEVIEPEADPHLIAYAAPQIIVLDIIDRDPLGRPRGYEAVKALAAAMGWQAKRWTATFASMQAVRQWWEKAQRLEGVEGWVLEDMRGEMVKFKTAYTFMWHQRRAIWQSGPARWQPDRVAPQHRAFVEWLRRQSWSGKESIIQVRDRWNRWWPVRLKLVR